MSTIVDLRKFRDRGRTVPTLVLVDLHHDLFDLFEVSDVSGPTQALDNCLALLRHARALGFPVAFTRRIAAPETFASEPNYPRWINGFEPQRSDMVFDRCLPSCYASADFAEMAEHLGGNFVVAGQVGELSCLSTAVDAFHRDQRPTFLTDALVTRGSSHLPALTMERALAHIISLYVETETAEGWMTATSRRLRVRE
jgi:nicotinamidase-related amidase